MVRKWAGFDWLISGSAFVLLGLSLLTIRSIAPGLFLSQIIYALLGLSLFFLFSRIDYRIYEQISWFIFIISIIFLSTTFIFGTVTRGTIRWLEIGGLTFQPSELVKPFLIISFAHFFSQFENLDFKKILLGVVWLLFPFILIFQQPDLGSSLVILFIWLGIVFAAGLNWRWLLGGLAIMLLAIPLFWQFLKEYQRQRIFTFINPMADPLGSGYHIVQSVVAIGSGQFFGRGLGHGTHSHLRFLPERHTDFIFASLSEELGFVGAIIVLIIFFLLLWRIIKISEWTNDRFAYLISIGVFSLIFVQAVINIGMNLGLLPITGITLPLVSSGGSSLVAILISLGILENISGFVKEDRL